MSSTGHVVRLHPTRAFKTRLSFTHALPGIVLVLTALDLLRGGAHAGHGPAWMPWLMLAAGASVLAAIAWELASHDPHRHAPVAWSEMFAGVMLVVEGLHRHKPHDAFQPAFGYYFAGLLTFVLGLNHARLAGMRRAETDENGLRVRLSLWRRSSARWNELDAIARDGDALVLTRRDGRVSRLSLDTAENRDELFAHLRREAARHGVTPNPLPRAVRRVQEALGSAGSEARAVVLDEPGKTADDAARVLDCDVARIVKSLVFRGATSGRALLVLVSGANRVNEARLAALAGEPVERATPEFVREHTGFTVGGVAPVGHPERLLAWLDEDLLAHGSVWASAGAAEAFVRLEPHELQRLTDATVARVG